MASLLLLLGLAFGAIGSVVFVVGLFGREKGRTLRSAGLLMACVLGPGACVVGMGPHVAPQVFLPAVAKRGNALVAALHKYEVDHHAPPARLLDLVPDYISEIPGTGFPGQCSWQYELVEGCWSLSAPIDGLLLDFDEYRYSPIGTPTAGYSTEAPPGGYRAVDRYGDWLYMDE